LTKEQEDAVHLESIRILEEIGIKVTSSSVLKMLVEHGADIDERTSVAKVSERMVKDALSKAPREFKMCARDKAHDLPLPAFRPKRSEKRWRRTSSI
jgi:trimethylamine--corrinoid protein Co-methyltransferase